MHAQGNIKRHYNWYSWYYRSRRSLMYRHVYIYRIYKLHSLFQCVTISLINISTTYFYLGNSLGVHTFRKRQEISLDIKIRLNICSGNQTMSLQIHDMNDCTSIYDLLPYIPCNIGNILPSRQLNTFQLKAIFYDDYNYSSFIMHCLSWIPKDIFIYSF